MQPRTFMILCSVMIAWMGGAAVMAAEPAAVKTPADAKKLQSEWAEKTGQPVQWTNKADMKFQLIPPGTFTMGSPEDDEDAPRHQVTLTQPFYIATLEVSRTQWEKVTGIKRSEFFPGADMPINFITWYDADNFLGKLNKLEERKAPGLYRLPTEAEWEFAARAGTTTRFFTGDDASALDKAGWFVGNSDNTMHPVGSKAANAFGLHDMHGNVWEWCSDFYDKDFYRFGPAVDPTGATQTMYRYRVLRGGSIYFPAQAARSYNRGFYQESRSEKHIGLRIVLPIVPAEEKKP